MSRRSYLGGGGTLVTVAQGAAMSTLAGGWWGRDAVSLSRCLSRHGRHSSHCSAVVTTKLLINADDLTSTSE